MPEWLRLALSQYGCPIVFLGVAEDVVTRESTAFDRTVSLALHQLANPALERVMQAFSTIGSAPVVLPIVALVVARTLECRCRVKPSC